MKILEAMFVALCLIGGFVLIVSGLVYLLHKWPLYFGIAVIVAMFLFITITYYKDNNEGK